MKKTIIIVILLSLRLEAYAFKEATHNALNQEIARRNIGAFSLDMHLVRNLGFQDGIKQEISGINAEGKISKSNVYEWLGYGGEQEDRPGSIMDYIMFRPTRSFNHFHTPLRMWSEAGLNDYILLPKVAPFPPFSVVGYTKKWYSGQSSLLWSQNSKQSVGGQWSWPSARKYFFNALTLTAKNQRDSNFADTFRAVGQLMHLVHDSSVPEHVRNDIHVLPSFGDSYPDYEQQVEDFRKREGAFWANLISNPVSFDKSILDIPITNPSASVPIARIIDSNLYTGSNPASTVMTQNSQQAIGLSEYVNANFVSKDTIFVAFDDEPQHSFAYPRADDLTWWIDNGKWYLRKEGNGNTINHLLRTSWLYWYRLKLFPQYKQYLPVAQDKECFKEYAQKLIPRAVGYSAGLLNYFFRGDVKLGFETSPVPGYIFTNNAAEKMEGDFGIYYDTSDGTRYPLWQNTGWIGPSGDKATDIDFIPPSDAKEPGKYVLVFKGKMGSEEVAVAGYVFHRLLEITPPDRFVYSMIAADENPKQFTEVRAKVRNTSNEAMGSGSLQAVIKYLKKVDDEKYSYAVSAPVPVNSLTTNASEYPFDFRQEPIPINATDVRLIILFRGTIGQEQNELAMGERDISEPTPVDFFNNMDMVCINGSWYVAGSQEAVVAADPDKDGKPNGDIYPHDIQDAYIKISSGDSGRNATPADYTFHISSLKAGGFYRSHVLSEYEASHSSYVTKVTIAAEDTWPHDIGQVKVPGAALRNQVELHGEQAYCQAEGMPTPCYVVKTDAMYPFRGKAMWGPMGIIFDNAPFPPVSTCRWDGL